VKRSRPRRMTQPSNWLTFTDCKTRKRRGFVAPALCIFRSQHGRHNPVWRLKRNPKSGNRFSDELRETKKSSCLVSSQHGRHNPVWRPKRNPKSGNRFSDELRETKKSSRLVSSQHGRHNPVWRLVPVAEGLDVDDNLLAHVHPALDGGRPHVRHQHGLRVLEQARVDRRFVFKHI
jgi:hypothetical protein